MTSPKDEKRSPLREKPLRNPGQSADRRVRELIDERVSVWLMMPILAGVFAAVEWAHWLLKIPPSPIFATVCAAVVAGLSWYMIRRARPLIAQYARGRDGEIAVGQYLEGLQRDGYQVRHDIPSERGNVDHVLIGPGGVFVIETKTISKPVGRESAVVYDGKQVTVDGHVPDRDPVAQVRAAARQIADTIRPNMARPPEVQPVLLYVGWWTAPVPKGSDIWLLNETALVKWVRGAYAKFSEEEVRQAAAALDMYVRNYPKA